MNNKHLSMHVRRLVDYYWLNHLDFWNEYTAYTFINTIREERVKKKINDYLHLIQKHI